ncbi:Testis development-related protein, partial [Galemys pyrenaicus]
GCHQAAELTCMADSVGRLGCCRPVLPLGRPSRCGVASRCRPGGGSLAPLVMVASQGLRLSGLSAGAPTTLFLTLELETRRAVEAALAAARLHTRSGDPSACLVTRRGGVLGPQQIALNMRELGEGAACPAQAPAPEQLHAQLPGRITSGHSKTTLQMQPAHSGASACVTSLSRAGGSGLRVCLAGEPGGRVGPLLPGACRPPAGRKPRASPAVRLWALAAPPVALGPPAACTATCTPALAGRTGMGQTRAHPVSGGAGSWPTLQPAHQPPEAPNLPRPDLFPDQAAVGISSVIETRGTCSPGDQLHLKCTGAWRLLRITPKPSVRRGMVGLSDHIDTAWPWSGTWRSASWGPGLYCRTKGCGPGGVAQMGTAPEATVEASAHPACAPTWRLQALAPAAWPHPSALGWRPALEAPRRGPTGPLHSKDQQHFLDGPVETKGPPVPSSHEVRSAAAALRASRWALRPPGALRGSAGQTVCHTWPVLGQLGAPAGPASGSAPQERPAVGTAATESEVGGQGSWGPAAGLWAPSPCGLHRRPPKGHSPPEASRFTQRPGWGDRSRLALRTGHPVEALREGSRAVRGSLPGLTAPREQRPRGGVQKPSPPPQWTLPTSLLHGGHLSPSRRLTFSFMAQPASLAFLSLAHRPRGVPDTGTRMGGEGQKYSPILLPRVEGAEGATGLREVGPLIGMKRAGDFLAGHSRPDLSAPVTASLRPWPPGALLASASPECRPRPGPRARTLSTGTVNPPEASTLAACPSSDAPEVPGGSWQTPARQRSAPQHGSPAGGRPEGGRARDLTLSGHCSLTLRTPEWLRALGALPQPPEAPVPQTEQSPQIWVWAGDGRACSGAAPQVGSAERGPGCIREKLPCGRAGATDTDGVGKLGQLRSSGQPRGAPRQDSTDTPALGGEGPSSPHACRGPTVCGATEGSQLPTRQPCTPPAPGLPHGGQQQKAEPADQGQGWQVRARGALADHTGSLCGCLGMGVSAAGFSVMGSPGQICLPPCPRAGGLSATGDTASLPGHSAHVQLEDGPCAPLDEGLGAAPSFPSSSGCQIPCTRRRAPGPPGGVVCPVLLRAVWTPAMPKSPGSWPRGNRAQARPARATPEVSSDVGAVPCSSWALSSSTDVLCSLTTRGLGRPHSVASGCHGTQHLDVLPFQSGASLPAGAKQVALAVASFLPEAVPDVGCAFLISQPGACGVQKCLGGGRAVPAGPLAAGECEVDSPAGFPGFGVLPLGVPKPLSALPPPTRSKPRSGLGLGSRGITGEEKRPRQPLSGAPAVRMRARTEPAQGPEAVALVTGTAAPSPASLGRTWPRPTARGEGRGGVLRWGGPGNAGEGRSRGAGLVRRGVGGFRARRGGARAGSRWAGAGGGWPRHRPPQSPRPGPAEPQAERLRAAGGSRRGARTPEAAAGMWRLSRNRVLLDDPLEEEDLRGALPAAPAAQVRARAGEACVGWGSDAGESGAQVSGAAWPGCAGGGARGWRRAGESAAQVGVQEPGRSGGTGPRGRLRRECLSRALWTLPGWWAPNPGSTRRQVGSRRGPSGVRGSRWLRSLLSGRAGVDRASPPLAPRPCGKPRERARGPQVAGGRVEVGGCDVRLARGSRSGPREPAPAGPLRLDLLADRAALPEGRTFAVQQNDEVVLGPSKFEISSPQMISPISSITCQREGFRSPKRWARGRGPGSGADRPAPPPAPSPRRRRPGAEPSPPPCPACAPRGRSPGAQPSRALAGAEGTPRRFMGRIDVWQQDTSLARERNRQSRGRRRSAGWPSRWSAQTGAAPVALLGLDTGLRPGALVAERVPCAPSPILPAALGRGCWPVRSRVGPGGGQHAPTPWAELGRAAGYSAGSPGACAASASRIQPERIRSRLPRRPISQDRPWGAVWGRSLRTRRVPLAPGVQLADHSSEGHMQPSREDSPWHWCPMATFALSCRPREASLRGGHTRGPQACAEEGPARADASRGEARGHGGQLGPPQCRARPSLSAPRPQQRGSPSLGRKLQPWTRPRRVAPRPSCLYPCLPARLLPCSPQHSGLAGRAPAIPTRAVQGAGFRGWKEVTSLFNRDDEQHLLKGCRQPKTREATLRLKEELKAEKKSGLWDVKQNVPPKRPHDLEGRGSAPLAREDDAQPGREDGEEGQAKSSLAGSGSRWALRSAGRLVSIRRQSRGHLGESWKELE